MSHAFRAYRAIQTKYLPTDRSGATLKAKAEKMPE